MESGGSGPRGLLLQLAVAHAASGGPRTAAVLSGLPRSTAGEGVSVLPGEPRSAHIESRMPGPAPVLVAEAKVPSRKATEPLLRDAVAPVVR